MLASGVGFLALFAAAKDDAAGAGILAGMAIYFIFIAVICVLTIAGMWKAFDKAGQPGWAAIVPIYNMYILNNEVAKKEPMWFILYIVGALICGPLALIAIIVINLAVAEKFGKGAGYGIGLSFLPFIFWPMLGFGSAKYQGGRRSRNDDYDDEEDEEEDEDDDRPRKKSDKW